MNFGPTYSAQGQHGPPKDCWEMAFKKKHANYLFPRLVVFGIMALCEGGKVIKGSGLEKPFYFSSYWAGVNKDSLNVNNDLINQSRWQCQEEFESKSSLLSVIKLYYTLNMQNINQQSSTWHWESIAPFGINNCSNFIQLSLEQWVTPGNNQF